MRQLAEFDHAPHADTLASVLFVEGIETRVDHRDEKPTVVWVVDERDLERAQEILGAFTDNPNDPRYREAKRQAATEQRKLRKKEKRQAKTMDMRARWRTSESGLGAVTFVLVAASTLVFMITFPGIPESLGTTRSGILEYLVYERTPRTYESVLGYFTDIMSGQVWRLVTPIFAHAEPRFSDGPIAGLLGFAHFLFNMWWLRDLGSRIENHRGSLFFVTFALTAAVLSNTAQYLVSGGHFIGMSGVVYGVFGYAWIRGVVDPVADTRYPTVPSPPCFCGWPSASPDS